MSSMSQTAFELDELQVPSDFSSWLPAQVLDLEIPNFADDLGLMTVRHAAGRLGVHENTVRNWIQRGLLPAHQLPGSGYNRVPQTEVERLRRQFLSTLASTGSSPDTQLPPETVVDIVPGDG